MKGIINHTDEINSKASSISKELYVFCNFSTEGYSHITAEGEFHNKVCLLYNAIHDTSIVLQHLKNILCVNPNDSSEWNSIKRSIDFRKFQDCCDTIHNLRACTAHNTSVDNGAIEKSEILFYENWKLKCCGKKIPDSIADYEKLVAELNSYDQFLYTWISQLLEYIDTNPNRKQIVINWKSETILWYCTKRDTFYGQLEDMYNALYKQNKNRLPQERAGIYTLNDWIRNTYCEPGVNELKKWDTLLSKAISRGIKGSSLTEMKNKIAEKKAETLHNIETEVLASIATHCHLCSNDLESRNFADYFFQKDLQILINQAFSDRKAVSLLPQDVLQGIVAERFMKITFDRLVSLPIN